MGGNEDIGENEDVIPEHILSEDDRRSIIEYELAHEDVTEIFLKKHVLVVRIMDDQDEKRFFIAVEPYECEQCKEEAKGNE